MKIIVLEGSPNIDGSTHILADCFRQGAEGADRQGSVNPVMRRIAVEGQALGKHGCHFLHHIAAGQAWPLRRQPMTAQALGQDCGRGLQKDDAACFTEKAPVFLGKHHAAAGGNDTPRRVGITAAPGSFLESFAFETPEGGPALFRNDVGDAAPRLFLEQGIRINERDATLRGKVFADGRLAAGARAHKKEKRHVDSPVFAAGGRLPDRYRKAHCVLRERGERFVRAFQL